jgi:hypothetical protein
VALDTDALCLQEVEDEMFAAVQQAFPGSRGSGCVRGFLLR